MGKTLSLFKKKGTYGSAFGDGPEGMQPGSARGGAGARLCVIVKPTALSLMVTLPVQAIEKEFVGVDEELIYSIRTYLYQLTRLHFLM